MSISQLNALLRSVKTRPSLRIAKSILPQRHWNSSTHFRGRNTQRARGGARWRDTIFADIKTKLALIHGVKPTYKELDKVPTVDLHEALRHYRASRFPYRGIVDTVEYLVRVRGEKPSLLHYDALIFANADPLKGSAEVVARLLAEMKQQGIMLDSGLYHSALHALAVHPDYLLRSKLLREMKERWLDPTRDGWHHIIVGLLRDRQYEIALDKLDEMREIGIKAHSWLHDLFIYVFCKAGEFDEALGILKYRVDSGGLDISTYVWHHLLDACSMAYHYEGTVYVWRRRVSLGYLNPSDGMCVNILNTAARFGDAQLATEVVRVIAKRQSKLDIHHYEAILEAYLGSRDLKNGFRVLTIMKKARLEPQEGSTRSIYTHLRGAEHLPSEALKILEELKAGGETIPVAAANCILEAFISHGKLDEAITQYKSLHKLCPSGPNTGTFNALLKGCSKAGRKDIAMFLASEMMSTKVRPDALTYDRLILVCLGEDNYEDAFQYLNEMGEMIKELRVGTWTAIVRKCVLDNDSRAWDIIGEMKARGLPWQKQQTWAHNEWSGDENAPRLLEPEVRQDENSTSGEVEEKRVQDNKLVGSGER